MRFKLFSKLNSWIYTCKFQFIFLPPNQRSTKCQGTKEDAPRRKYESSWSRCELAAGPVLNQACSVHSSKGSATIRASVLSPLTRLPGKWITYSVVLNSKQLKWLEIQVQVNFIPVSLVLSHHKTPEGEQLSQIHTSNFETISPCECNS